MNTVDFKFNSLIDDTKFSGSFVYNDSTGILDVQTVGAIEETGIIWDVLDNSILYEWLQSLLCEHIDNVENDLINGDDLILITDGVPSSFFSYEIFFPKNPLDDNEWQLEETTKLFEVSLSNARYVDSNI